MIRYSSVGVGLVATLLASTIQAQSRTHALPKAVSGVFAGGRAFLPLGLPPTTTLQTWYTGRDVPRVALTAGSLRGDPVFGVPSATSTLEIKYVNSPLTFSQFSPTLASKEQNGAAERGR